MRHGYQNLAVAGWKEGVHKAPAGYEHPWVVVFQHQTIGCWTRAEARKAWKNPWNHHIDDEKGD